MFDLSQVAYNIGEWFYTRFYDFMLLILVIVVGVIFAKIVRAYTRKFCEKIKINQTISQMIIPASYGITIVIAVGFALYVLVGRIFMLPTVWFSGSAVLILKTVVVFVLGSTAISFLCKMMMKTLSVSNIDATLHPFLVSAVKAVSFILLGIICIDILGIPTASVVAAMASVGLALSLSVKDHLSNLIGGIIVLMTKPFKGGDYIEIDGVNGIVEEIGLIYTVLKTFDNKNIYIPNNDAASAKIINHSRETSRRLDLVFSIGYNSDYDKARLLILKAIAETGLAILEPAPVVRMSAHAASAIEIDCKVWVEWENYYELKVSMHENIKKEFDENGITIPFNQLDLHVTAT